MGAGILRQGKVMEAFTAGQTEKALVQWPDALNFLNLRNVSWFPKAAVLVKLTCVTHAKSNVPDWRASRVKNLEVTGWVLYKLEA